LRQVHNRPMGGTATKARGSAGFTLVEIMVVVVIIGILAVLIVPRVVGRSDDARIAAAKHDVAALMQSLKLYRLDNGRYPTSEQGLQALVAKPQSSPVPTNWRPYVDKLPKDPWGNPYQYLSPGVHGEIDVFSFGADGQAGGSGADSDVGSWHI
jgi:general secretion pathway protein G